MNGIVALPTISAGGSLESYIQAVNRFPILSQEEETSLARRFLERDDVDAALSQPRQSGLAVGRTLVAIKQNEPLVRAQGISPMPYKLAAFSISAAITASGPSKRRKRRSRRVPRCAASGSSTTSPPA